MSATTRMKIMVALLIMLSIGGLVEYLIILNVHSYSYWDWTVPDKLHSYSADGGYKPHISLIGSALQRQGLGKKLEQLGKERVLANREPLTGTAQVSDQNTPPKTMGDSFYELRGFLLKRVGELLQEFESKINDGKRSHDPRRAKVQSDVRSSDSGGGLENDWFPHDSRAINARGGGGGGGGGDGDGNFGIHFFDHEVSTLESIYGPEVLVENDTSLPAGKLSPFEAAGNNVMLTLRTVKKYHNRRLPLLFETWLSKVNGSNVFLMSDGRDPLWQSRAWSRGMHYVLSACTAYTAREDRLCCRTGTEMAQIFKPGYEHYDWSCHVDDDMYVRIPPLVELLSKFDPKKDAVYLGRSGSPWFSPRKVVAGAKLGTPGQGYHFAVGGMFCLSRAMLELARPYLVGGKNFSKTCAKTQEPDDVTVGFIVGVVLNKTLSRTEKIYTHGLHLVSTVDPETLGQQIAFSYGFGATHWGYDDYNAIYVPGALYSIEEDESQFRSLHCYLYPSEKQCIKRVRSIIP